MNEFNIKNGFISNSNSIVVGSLTATTFYGNGQYLTGINDFYVTGGTFDSGTNTLTLGRQNGSVTITGFTSGGGSSSNGNYLPLSGGTIYGNLTVTGNTTLNSTTVTTLYTNYIDFNTTATTTTQFGRINWDSGTGTLNIGIGDSTTGLVDFQVGQEEVVRVFNSEATPLTAGTIVYVSGSNGNRPSVKRALATTDGYSVTTLGMVDTTITSGSEGYVTTFGVINNLNTLNLSGGTPIWLSPTVPGGYTSTKPKAPDHTVLIGYVVRVHPTVGSIFVNISNGWEIDELHDVRLNGRSQGDLLVYSSYNGSNVWVNSKTLNGDYTISGNTNNLGSFSATTFYGSGIGLNNIPVTGVTNLQSSLDLKTDLSLFTSHTGNTNNPHQTTFYNLVSTAHTHTISDIIDLQTNLNLKFDKSGGTVNGDVLVLGNVTILGSATTINTQTLSVADTVVTLNSNLTGGTPYPGHSGIEVLRGSGTTAAMLWEEQNSQWEAGLHGSTKRILLQGDSLALLTSGHTHPISQINNLQNILNNKFDTSGGTINGNVLINGSLTATTYYGDGSQLTNVQSTNSSSKLFNYYNFI